MGKLPKSMQNKKKQARELRAKGSATLQKKHRAHPVPQNRQMRRRLKQQGIGDMEQIEANRVIIQTDTEDLVIEAPQIIRVNQQGMNVYQVIGNAEPYPSGTYSGQATEVSENLEDVKDIEDANTDLSLNVEITEQDIQLVVMQTNVSTEIAKQTLQETNGDLAKAIIKLKTK
ncbi:nascent polypeptide-associated complex protein [Candidatus Harpocratesius sp.]